MDRLKDGYYVRIPQLQNDGVGEWFVIAGSESFNYATNDGTATVFSAVADAADSGYINITEMEPHDIPRRLYQVVFGVKDGCDYFFKIPTGSNRFGVDEDKDVGYFTNRNSYYLAKNEDYQFWLVKNYFPSINASNDSGASVTPKVYFEGIKYDIDKVTDPNVLGRLKAGQLPSTTVTIGGVRT
jgi:hypothetical protein